MARRDTESDTGVVTETERKVDEPRLYKVLLHNDDFTTMEFVVQVLQLMFHKPLPEATQIMLHVHRQGIGLCGTYSYEVAETKVAEVLALARAHEYPLQCSMEPA
ncbi:MAG: ATP-dependent Clp protease adapter ClpS [Deltaproteobacteria bacterium]|nr:ATP-dependent Clp protease adapter ClpS [Deltaproteobacteria bacterium]